jgi:hypothetical protein
MSSDSPSPEPEPETSYSYDEGRLTEIREVTENGKTVTVYVHRVKESAPSFSFVHDKQKRLFILTWPDGKTERFRDNPARELMVEPDPETGEMRPVLKRGQPVYVYLCREERELT